MEKLGSWWPCRQFDCPLSIAYLHFVFHQSGERQSRLVHSFFQDLLKKLTDLWDCTWHELNRQGFLNSCLTSRWLWNCFRTASSFPQWHDTSDTTETSSFCKIIKINHQTQVRKPYFMMVCFVLCSVHFADQLSRLRFQEKRQFLTIQGRLHCSRLKNQQLTQHSPKFLFCVCVIVLNSLEKVKEPLTSLALLSPEFPLPSSVLITWKKITELDPRRSLTWHEALTLEFMDQLFTFAGGEVMMSSLVFQWTWWNQKLVYFKTTKGLPV